MIGRFQFSDIPSALLYYESGLRGWAFFLGVGQWNICWSYIPAYWFPVSGRSRRSGPWTLGSTSRQPRPAQTFWCTWKLGMTKNNKFKILYKFIQTLKGIASPIQFNYFTQYLKKNLLHNLISSVWHPFNWQWTPNYALNYLEPIYIRVQLTLYSASEVSDHSSGGLVFRTLQPAERCPGHQNTQGIPESVDTHGFHHYTAFLAEDYSYQLLQ